MGFEQIEIYLKYIKKCGTATISGFMLSLDIFTNTENITIDPHVDRQLESSLSK